MSAHARPMGANSLILKVGMRSRKPIGSLDLTVGIERPSNSRCVLARENRGSFLTVYIARVRITVHADGVTIVREGHGSGEGRGTSPGEVHDIALKAAETDATKRALATFGKPFGLELYRNSKRPPAQNPASLQPALPSSDNPPRLGLHPDDTKTREDVTAPPLAPPLAPTKIDKSQLAIAEPKRLRDKAHLKFVASQPCLLCGRQPSDPHHLRFAQPRAIGLKVSDEFTVPLCRGHHRQLHQAGNELAWWETLKINALEAAKQFWEQTHSSSGLTLITDDGSGPNVKK